MICPNYGVAENWPRVGLEALAAGVPVLADDAGGWQEMVEHGETGFLCAGPDDYVRWLVALAGDEVLRQRIIHNAQRSLVSLVSPMRIGVAWQRLFRYILEDGNDSGNP
jgi:glycosyltransferase involved in cell wall biosynthesis